MMIIHNETTPLGRFAAEELSKYLDLILSAPTHYRFSLASDPSLPEEVFCITIQEGAVSLRGCGRGLLYAVYEFLERYLGCSFGALAHPEVNTGEVIPTLDTLDLPEGEYLHTPDLSYRTAIVQFHFWAGEADRGLTLPFFDWLAKNRYNRLLLWVSCYEKLKKLGWLEELEKRGFALTVGHHQATFTFLPPFGNEYFPTAYRTEHPEYFKLLENGERYAPKDMTDYNGQWLLCSRNEECLQTVADNILYWLDRNPMVDTIAFWPNDGKKPQCTCPVCAPYSKTENYLYFNNELSRRIAGKRPDVKIDTLIYMDLWDCPEGTVLSDNVVIDVAMCKDAFRPYGKRDGSCVLGTAYEQNLRDYRAAAASVVAYEYYMGNFANRQKTVPAADEMQSIFSFMKAQGISGSGTQIECFNHWNNLFNFYCFGRTADDVSLSAADHMERFCRLFGKGAPQIREILRLYEDTLEGQVPMNEAGIYLIEHIEKERIYSLFEAALAAADNARCRNNIRMMRLAFRYSDLTVSDPVEDKSSHRLLKYEDKTGELAYMAAHYDSYFANYTGYGISVLAEGQAPDTAPDKWYEFEV